MDELEDIVNKVLNGIDKTETEADEGWGETSFGADFGRRKKKELLEKLRHLTKRAPDLAESCAWECHGRSDEICNHCTQYKSPSG